MQVRNMLDTDWEQVAKIYKQGIDTGIATFQTEIPDFKTWNNGHLKLGRLVAIDEDQNIVGWTALSPISSRDVYKGVVELSIYIDEKMRHKGIGSVLLQQLIQLTEENEVWTIQSSIFAINKPSISLHIKNGFRNVGKRKQIAKDTYGQWQDTILMERRSQKI